MEDGAATTRRSRGAARSDRRRRLVQDMRCKAVQGATDAVCERRPYAQERISDIFAEAHKISDKLCNLELMVSALVLRSTPTTAAVTSFAHVPDAGGRCPVDQSALAATVTTPRAEESGAGAAGGGTATVRPPSSGAWPPPPPLHPPEMRSPPISVLTPPPADEPTDEDSRTPRVLEEVPWVQHAGEDGPGAPRFGGERHRAAGSAPAPEEDAAARQLHHHTGTPTAGGLLWASFDIVMDSLTFVLKEGDVSPSLGEDSKECAMERVSGVGVGVEPPGVGQSLDEDDTPTTPDDANLTTTGADGVDGTGTPIDESQTATVLETGTRIEDVHQMTDGEGHGVDPVQIPQVVVMGPEIDMGPEPVGDHQVEVAGKPEPVVEYLEEVTDEQELAVKHLDELTGKPKAVMENQGETDVPEPAAENLETIDDEPEPVEELMGNALDVPEPVTQVPCNVVECRDKPETGITPWPSGEAPPYSPPAVQCNSKTAEVPREPFVEAAEVHAPEIAQNHMPKAQPVLGGALGVPYDALLEEEWESTAAYDDELNAVPEAVPSSSASRGRAPLAAAAVRASPLVAAHVVENLNDGKLAGPSPVVPALTTAEGRIQVDSSHVGASDDERAELARTMRFHLRYVSAKVASRLQRAFDSGDPWALVRYLAQYKVTTPATASHVQGLLEALRRILELVQGTEGSAEPGAPACPC